MRRQRSGFTLIELLVVIAIILILMSLVTVMVKGIFEKARNTKTSGLIRMLDSACGQYRVSFQQFPPDTIYGAGNSKNLHLTLGSARRLPTQFKSDGTVITKEESSLIEFKRDMLMGEPANPYPMTPGNVFEVMDAWGKALIYYRNYNPPSAPRVGAKNPTSVDIWSVGKSDTDAGDDINNWTRD